MRLLSIIFSCLLLVFALNTLFTAAAYAQAPAPKELLEEKMPEAEILKPETSLIPEPIDPNNKPLPFDDYSDIPEEALQEMQKFNQSCGEDLILSRHYNCDCWSARFLEERIRRGPAVSEVQVMLDISGECFNIPGAAGYAHAKCEKSGSATYDGGMSPDEYCQCIANNYALQVKAMAGQSLTRQRVGNMYTSSILRCNTPKPGQRNVFRRLDKPIGTQTPIAPPPLDISKE